MTRLETAILKCNNVIYPSELKEFLRNDKDLTTEDRKKFEEMWNTAADFENWNYSDLALGCKITHQRLKNRFDLSDECIAIIVRVVAYDWK